MIKLGLSLVGMLWFVPAATAQINYGEALQKSIYFYEAQQSGVLPDWNRVPWRGDATIKDGQDQGVDLSGGWYDAGDHVKFGLPMAAAANMLAWGVVTYPEAYQATGQMVHIKNNLRFVADYFVNAHPEPNVFYGQVGKGSDDHAWWGPVEVLHAVNRSASNRPAFAISPSCPGSDLAGETAAALASIAMIFQNDDPAYSALLIKHARELYDFADRYRGRYSDCITDASGFYRSWSGYNDELVWGALWLYQATGDEAYLNKAEALYDDLNTEPQSSVKSFRWTHAWDDKSYGSYVLLAKLTGKEIYQQDAQRWLDYWTTGYQGQRITYTPGGLARLDSWGATRYAANTSFLALVYADYLRASGLSADKAQTYYDFAVGQIEYIMGKNPMGIPYQIGMSPNGPQNPHHRTAHGSWSDSLQFPAQSRHLLIGALVGGPSNGDSYKDDRGDYIANEVACDYNAGFTSALARLYLDFGGDPIAESEFPPPEDKDLEFYTETKVNAAGDRFIELSTVVYNQSAWPARVTNNLKFRYWVDLSDELQQGFDIKDFTVTTAYSQASSVSELKPWQGSSSIYVVEVSFAGVDIFPGGQSEYKKEVQFRIALGNQSKNGQLNYRQDPSWEPAYENGRIASKAVALYDGDKLLWGQEP